MAGAFDLDGTNSMIAVAMDLSRDTPTWGKAEKLFETRTPGRVREAPSSTPSRSIVTTTSPPTVGASCSPSKPRSRTRQLPVSWSCSIGGPRCAQKPRGDDEPSAPDPPTHDTLSHDGPLSPTDVYRLAIDAGAPPQRIGPYRLLRRVGEGGMGEVWEAEQSAPLRRRVAIKLVKLGMDTRQFIARFESERQALALMEHPSIARVFDGGATDDRPSLLRHGVRRGRADHGVLRPRSA